MSSAYLTIKLLDPRTIRTSVQANVLKASGIGSFNSKSNSPRDSQKLFSKSFELTIRIASCALTMFSEQEKLNKNNFVFVGKICKFCHFL